MSISKVPIQATNLTPTKPNQRFKALKSFLGFNNLALCFKCLKNLAIHGKPFTAALNTLADQIVGASALTAL